MDQKWPSLLALPEQLANLVTSIVVGRSFSIFAQTIIEKDTNITQEIVASRVYINER